MIFAKVDVDFPSHHRLIRVPVRSRAEALGVWLAAVCYSRKHELNGFCPLAAIDQVARPKVVGQLVDVGLLAREEQDRVHGVRVLRYAEHNETKDEISERRSATRVRVAEFRGKLKLADNAATRPVTNAVHNRYNGHGNSVTPPDGNGVTDPPSNVVTGSDVTTPVTDPCNVSVPGSDSDSDSDLFSGSGSPRSEIYAPQPLQDRIPRETGQPGPVFEVSRRAETDETIAARKVAEAQRLAEWAKREGVPR